MSEYYLVHHGIKGQKWGVRRFQDYDGHRTAAGIARYGDRLSKFIKTQNAKLSLLRVIKEEKRVLDDMYDSRDIKSLDHAPRLTAPMTPEDSAKLTNPGFPGEGSILNCGPCSIAMVMREKGYDVVAAKTSDGFTEFGLQDLFTFQGSFQMTSDAKNAGDLTSQIQKHGDGAYGIIGVEYTDGGGHFMFWKNENGSPAFYDGQDGTKCGTEMFDYIKTNRTTLSRLDNATPKPRVLSVVRRRE